MNAARWRVIHWIMDLAIICEALLLANLAKWVLPFGLEPVPGTNFVTPLILAVFLISWSFLARVTGLYYSRQPTTLMLDLQKVVATLVLTLVVVASLLLFLKYTFSLVCYCCTSSLFRFSYWQPPGWCCGRPGTYGAPMLRVPGGCSL